MLEYWIDLDVLYELNNYIRKHKVTVIKDYTVLYGVEDDFIEVLNLKSGEVAFRAEFEPVGGIELLVKKVEIYPDVIGFGAFNHWLGEFISRVKDNERLLDRD